MFKMIGKLLRNKRNKNEEADENTDKNITEETKHSCKLIILYDTKKDGVLDYLKTKGICASSLCYNIEEAKIKLLTEYGRSRLVVVETGTGNFTSAKSKAELLDLIGMCGDEKRKITVFCTKLEKSKKKNKCADWVDYECTVELVKKLLTYNENYDDSCDLTTNSGSKKEDEYILQYKGCEIENNGANFDRRFVLEYVKLMDLVCKEYDEGVNCEKLVEYTPNYN